LFESTPLLREDDIFGQESSTLTMSAFQNGMAQVRTMDDDSDVEEEALVADYREQVQFEDIDALESVPLSMAQQTDDIQGRLAQAAQPLDFNAPLEVKFQSYDAYCSLFHFILNSEGPVDLEPPSVGQPASFPASRTVACR
jgi:translation initiation factor 3 subunit L